MNKKMPIIVLVLLLIMLVPMFVFMSKAGNSPELGGGKTKIINNFSKYEKKLNDEGLDAKVVETGSKKYIEVVNDGVTYRFDSANGCTAIFSNKSFDAKYTAEMFVSNIGTSDISMSVVQIYQNQEFTYKCNYDKSGFSAPIADADDFARNDRKIKELTDKDYRISDIYSRIQSYNNIITSVLKDSKEES